MSIGLSETPLATTGAAVPRGRALTIGLDIAERATVVLAFIFFLSANFASGSPINVLLCAADAITVFCILLRRPCDSVSLSPFDWGVAIAGCLLPMLARPGGHPLVPISAPAAIWFGGLWISVAAQLPPHPPVALAPAHPAVHGCGAHADT